MTSVIFYYILVRNRTGRKTVYYIFFYLLKTIVNLRRKKLDNLCVFLKRAVKHLLHKQVVYKDNYCCTLVESKEADVGVSFASLASAFAFFLKNPFNKKLCCKASRSSSSF